MRAKAHWVLEFKAPQCVLFGVAPVDLVEPGGLGARSPWAHRRTAPVVDQAPVGNGQEPCPELNLAAGEGADAGEGAEEHLAGEVFRVVRSLEAKVGEDRRGERSIEPLEAPGNPGLGGSEYGLETFDGQDGPSAVAR